MKKYWYIQDWGTYQEETYVFVGYTIPEITKILLKKKLMLGEAMEKWTYEWKNSTHFDDKAGGVWSHKGHSVLYLPEWKGNWDSYETLIHECFHLIVAVLGRSMLFVNERDVEEEGMAYQLEYLFRNIRIRLQKQLLDKKKKK